MAYNQGHNREWDRGKDWQQQGYSEWNGGGGGGGGDWHGGGGGGNNEWHGGGGGGRRERDWEEDYNGDGKRRKFNDGVRLFLYTYSMIASLENRDTSSKDKEDGEDTARASNAWRPPSRPTTSSSSASTQTLQKLM